MELSPSHNRTLEEIDRESVFHPFTALAQHMETGARIMSRGEGVRLYDNHGRSYIDALAGLWCVNVGYGRREIADAMHAQAVKLPYYHSFASMGTEPAIHVADRLKRMAPGQMARVFFGTTGSDANDTQVKLVRYYNNLLGRPHKKKIVARDRAYHGVTVAAASLTGLPVLHNAFDLPMEGVLRLTCPHYYREGRPGETEEAFSTRLAEEFEALVLAEGPETVAAFIAEPVMGAGGVVVPPAGYFEKMQAVCRRHDILVIADEVICGFGRLGTMFGSDMYGIEPDLISVAKGITSGYVPLSAVLVAEKVWSVVCENSRSLGVFGHGYTYTSHPVSCAAATANLDIVERERLVDNARGTGAYLQATLRERIGGHPLVGEVRGIGLIAAAELVADRATGRGFDKALGVAKRVAAAALERGLIVRALPHGDALAFSPPLTITRAEVDAVVDTFGASVEAVADALATDGVGVG
jgi:L-2,4-diaminobutyrate transaminase